MIKTTTTDGKKLRILLNESIILPERNASVNIEVQDANYDIHIYIDVQFIDTANEPEFSGKFETSEDNNTLFIKLYNWNPNQEKTYNYIENISYSPIAITGGKNIYLKFRTTSDKKNNWRTFHLTVWGDAK